MEPNEVFPILVEVGEGDDDRVGAHALSLRQFVKAPDTATE